MSLIKATAACHSKPVFRICHANFTYHMLSISESEIIRVAMSLCCFRTSKHAMKLVTSIVTVTSHAMYKTSHLIRSQRSTKDYLHDTIIGNKRGEILSNNAGINYWYVISSGITDGLTLSVNHILHMCYTFPVDLLVPALKWLAARSNFKP